MKRIDYNNYVVSMIGSRISYAVPLALNKAGKLGLFYTDIWFKGLPVIAPIIAPNITKKIRSRSNNEIDSSKVISFNMQSYLDILVLYFSRKRKSTSLYDHYLKQGASFARRVANHMLTSGISEKSGVFLSHSTQALETFQFLIDKNYKKVLDQFDAGGQLDRILYEEQLSWPDWVSIRFVPNRDFQERRAQEWSCCDIIIVKTDYVKDALVSQGVDSSKIKLVDPVYSGFISKQRSYNLNKARPIRVLFLGRVGLTKGIQYLCEAAKHMDKNRFKFTVAGPLEIKENILAEAPENMQFLGPIPRQEIGRLFEFSDLYVLPTLSDNCPSSVLEAMAYGVPPLVTRESGAPIEDGKDGLMIRARDAYSIVEALERVDAERELIPFLGNNAISKVKKYSLDNFMRSLTKVIEQ